MMPMTEEELLSFFIVLVRISIVVAIAPFLGDKVVPLQVKILLSLAISAMMYPVLVNNGYVNPGDAQIWSASLSGVVGTVAIEAMVGLSLGFVSRFVFDAVSFGSNLNGTFMGYAAASMFDPHQESQSQVVSQIQMALAMLLFLGLDGHHYIVRAALDSYRILGIGMAHFGGAFNEQLLALSAQSIRIGLQISAPIAISLFMVNVVYGVMAKAMPQLNILVLSFAVSAILGLVVLFLSLPEFMHLLTNVFEKMGDDLWLIIRALAQK